MGSLSGVRSVRASAEEWGRWAVAASGSGSLNAWVRAVCNEAADRVLAERRRAEDELAKKELVKGALRGEGYGW